MIDSPYAPPRAALADVEEAEDPMDRPWQVARATTCLWIKFGIGVATALWNVVYISPQLAMFSRPVIFAFYAVLFLITAWIYRSIGKGRDWARILFLILTGISILGVPFSIFAVKIGTVTSAVAMTGLVNICISGYAAYLLLTAPSRAWYKNMKGRKG
jgi:FtsH-binding integral membrane protein